MTKCPDCQSNIYFECLNCISKENKWIECSEKLPEKSARYLVYEEKDKHAHNCAAYNYPYPCCEVNIAYFRCFQTADWSWSSFTDMKCTPTHWMPLPPPKENQ